MKSDTTTRPSSRLLGVAAALVVTFISCTGAIQQVPPTVYAGGGTHIVQRVAKGCPACRVSVAVTAIPGPVPDLANPPAFPMIVAYLANVGEGGRNENRYDLKPSTQAGYELELKKDGNDIRWTIIETMSGSNAGVAHRTGLLKQCDSDSHYSPGRDINFKDCRWSNNYDPRETAAMNARVLQLAFASSPSNPRGLQSIPLGFASSWVEAIVSRPPWDAPGWVSCKSGCCTLAQ
jgi:hypothetical protein